MHHQRIKWQIGNMMAVQISNLEPFSHYNTIYYFMFKVFFHITLEVFKNKCLYLISRWNAWVCLPISATLTLKDSNVWCNIRVPWVFFLVKKVCWDRKRWSAKLGVQTLRQLRVNGTLRCHQTLEWKKIWWQFRFLIWDPFTLQQDLLFYV